MPAVTVDNPLTLPRVTAPAGARPRPALAVSTAPTGLEGEGFPVRRAFAGIDYRHLDPFILMDQMGEVEYAPGEPKGTPWHPHRGFETVTYIMDGTFVHQDSHGGGGTITNGDTQWMTAGSGLLHIETPPESLVVSGGLFHGLQLWVNLPKADKMIAPKYQDIRAGGLKLLTSGDGGALIRLIAGDLTSAADAGRSADSEDSGGSAGPGTAGEVHRGPGATHTPITMIHVSLAPGAALTLPWRPDFNALAYGLSGRGLAGPEGRPFGMGQSVVFGQGDALTLRADGTQDSRSPGFEVVLLGGLPIREPMMQYGPFVMNTHAELAQAFDDFQAGRLGTIPVDSPYGR